MVLTADMAAHDQRPGARLAQGVAQIGPAPQQRKRHCDQPGPQNCEQREHGFDRIGDLEGHEGVGMQAQTPQSARQCRNHVIGLCISQPARRPAGERLPIGRIDQRHRVRPPFRVAAEQVIERGAATDARREVLIVQVGENHGGVIVPHATMFRGDVP